MPEKEKKPAVRKTRSRGLRDTRSRSMRDTINVLALIEALEQHVLGKNKMTATQVNAALALLKKTLPDISEPARKPAPETTAPSKAHEDVLQELE